MRYDTRNFLLVPFPAFGHITPLLELARKFTASGHHVTFLVSGRLLIDMRNRKMMTPAEETAIRFVGLQDDVIIPPDITANPILWKGIDAKTDVAFEKFLSEMPINHQSSEDMLAVDVVVVDICLAEPFRVPRLRGVPVVGFSPFGGFLTIRILSINENTPTIRDEDLYKEMPPDAMIDVWKQSALRMKKELSLSKGLFINSYTALEPNFENDFRTACPEFASLRHAFIGPVLPPGIKREEKVARWLDGQNDRCAIYFSFGTITMVNAAQVQEVASALIGLHRPFIWSLQAAQQEYLSEEIQKTIQTQFDEANSPYLVLSWAPQKMILQHKAVRLFVSHSGWNSTLECISSGVPMVAWPMFGDQHENADLVVSAGCGLRMDRVDMSGERIVQKEELSNLIERVAQWDKPIEENKFFMTAQRLGVAALDAVKDGGSSVKAFADLLAISATKF